jgi:hypothetical protein
MVPICEASPEVGVLVLFQLGGKPNSYVRSAFCPGTWECE